MTQETPVSHMLLRFPPFKFGSDTKGATLFYISTYKTLLFFLS